MSSMSFSSWVTRSLARGLKFLHRSLSRSLAIGLLILLFFSGAGLLLAAPARAEDYNREFLVGADFSGKVLTNDSFTKANMREANFSGANLRGVSFFGGNLESANLEGADLSYTTLDAARMTNANLTNAILEGAFAFNAKFEGATIDGADFTDVEVRQDALTLLCKLAKGTNPVTGRDTRETLNCP